VHPFMHRLGRFLSPCNLLPLFVVFVGHYSKK
jgi:hypothetical protein